MEKYLVPSLKTKEIMKKVTGLSYDDLVSTEVETIVKKIENKKKIKLKFGAYQGSNLCPRGSVYIQEGRLIFPEIISKMLAKISNF